MPTLHLRRSVPASLAIALSVVLAACSGGGGDGGGSSTQATNPQPSNGATGVAENTGLSWAAAIGAVGYEIFLDDDASLGDEDLIVATTETSTSTPGLLPATTYFWRVDALDGNGGRVPSAVFQFTTAVPLDDTLLGISMAGTISINGGAARPITYSTYGGRGSGPAVLCDFGEYNCEPGMLPWPEGYGWLSILTNADDVPTGVIEITLSDDPTQVRVATGVDVSFDGGRRYSGVGTATAAGLSDVTFGFNVVADEETTTFVLDGSTAHLNGLIGPTTRSQVQVLANDHPEIDTIQFGCILGSIDDGANLQAGQLLRSSGFHTRAVADTDTASGGVDLFTAGVSRTVADGAKFRVHSWGSEDGPSATDFQPCPGHPAHQSYVSFLNQMMGAPLGEQFYCFTINACQPGCTHTMTADEVVMFGLATQ